VACALAALAAGCQGYSTDFTTPVAIEIISPHKNPPGNLEEFDTLRLGAVVLDRGGDTVPGAVVRLVALDSTIVVDSLTRAVTGLPGLNLASPVTGRVIGLAGTLQSAPFVVTVLRAPDLLGVPPSGTTQDTVPAGDSISAPLRAELFDTRSTPGTPQPLNWGVIGDTVRFAILSPAITDTATAPVDFGKDTLAVAAVTASGVAAVVLHRRGASQPDSVVVQATAHRAVGATPVQGSPLQFVVYFH